MFNHVNIANKTTKISDESWARTTVGLLRTKTKRSPCHEIFKSTIIISHHRDRQGVMVLIQVY